MIILLFAFIGLWVGALINVLADDWPRREPPSRPHCPQCGHVYGPGGWLGIGRKLWGGGKCPQCGRPVRKRVLLVEGGTAVLFAALPYFFTTPVALLVNSFYMAILVLVIVIDLENRLILDIVTLPGTILALLFSFILPGINIVSALLGAALGLLIFLGVYWLAKVTFGAGAIGQGDVKLAMMMGAMLGVPGILTAVLLGIVLGGVISGFLLATRLVKRGTFLPYGQYLAAAAMVMLLWGQPLNNWLFQ
jgi:prepilin signal peptidase PulO-like enzyme (type II secretory pathway)